MEDKPIDSLNMIPFIDIMLVLLTIVLVTSSFIASGRIPLALPQASAEMTEKAETEIIEIDAAGQIYYDGAAMRLEALGARLASLDKNAPILLRADKTLPLQGFVEVAALLKGLGFGRVALQTERVRR